MPHTTKFPLGQTTTTPDVLDNARAGTIDIPALLARHQSGDWGDLSPNDRMLNDLAVDHGDRILSHYHTAGGRTVYVITEADRSTTTILFTEEY